MMKSLNLLCIIFCVTGIVVSGDEDPCNTSPCKNGGTCTAKGSSYICECPDGYKGRRCQICLTKESKNKNRGNSGKKIKKNSQSKSSGKSGKKCFKNALECYEFTSIFDGESDPNNDNTITCAGSRESSCYTFIHTDTVFHKGCISLKNCEALQTLNGPSCTSVEQGTPGCIFCCGDKLCNDAAPEHPCDAVTCPYNMKCQVSAANEPECVCNDGFFGENCDQSVSCNAEQCLNGASCGYLGSYAFCDCDSTFVGVYCEIDNQEYNCETQSPCPPSGSQTKFRVSDSATDYVECDGSNCSVNNCEPSTVFSVKDQSCVAETLP